MDKHVLVIADYDDNDLLSFEKARDVAHDISTHMEIIKFVQYDSESDGPIEYFIGAAEEKLNANIDKVFEDRSEITTNVVVTDDVDTWVTERCMEPDNTVDLVIIGGHRTETLFHLPTDWKLIRHLPCPILIASHTKWKSNANILMTLDLAHNDATHQQLNEATLSWGKTWSEATHTKLHAMYTIPIPKPLLDLEIVDKQRMETDKSPKAKDRLEKILTEHEMESAIPHIAVGPPDKEIPHLANELHSDLVIMGCVGRDGVSGMLIGNTAEKVLHHLRTDCLIVKLPKN